MKKSLIMSAFIFNFLSCAGSVQNNIEEAQFLLDKSDFTGAQAKAEAALVEDPASVDAKYVLASALLGGAVLGQNKTALDLIADLQREQTSGESNFETFVRIAPDTTSKLSNLERATDTLAGISTTAPERLAKNVYLKLYISRLFEIAGAVTRIGANSQDLVCNADPNNALKDGVPDSLSPNALTAAQSTRFQNNLDNVNSDGEKAGLPTSFALNDRLLQISSDISSAVSAAGGDQATGFANFFNDAFGNTGGSAPCIVPK